MTFASFVSSLFPTVYADAPAEEPKAEEPEAEEPRAEEQKTEETQDVSEEPAEQTTEEEEESEPEDVRHPLSLIFLCAVCRLKCAFKLQPELREECQKSPQCAPFTKHYLHCQEKVSSGQGFKGEDCVEEL